VAWWKRECVDVRCLGWSGAWDCETGETGWYYAEELGKSLLVHIGKPKFDVRVGA